MLLSSHIFDLMQPRLVFLFIFSYSDIVIEREVLMQKYIHLVQIVETEKVAANQLRTQLEDQDTEIERLKAEVAHWNCDLRKSVALTFDCLVLSCWSLFLLHLHHIYELNLTYKMDFLLL